MGCMLVLLHPSSKSQVSIAPWCSSDGLLQERKAIQKEGLRLARLTGADLTPAVWDQFYRFYRNTTGSGGLAALHELPGCSMP